MNSPQNPHQPSNSISNSKLLTILACGLILLLLSLFTSRAQEHIGIQSSVSAIGLGFLVWIAILFKQKKPFSITLNFKKNHYLQMCVQLTLFIYWGAYWSEVRDQWILIVIQLIVAYLLDMLIAWSRYGTWRVGVGPIPPVLSVNLFLWFKDPFFIFQLGMIATAALTKEFIKWTAHGRRVHIFNPSGIALTAFAIPLLIFDSWDMTKGLDISIQLGAPESMYIVMFVCSLLVQFTHRVILVTLSSVLTIIALGGVYTLVTDLYLFVDTSIPIAVFLGTLLLITDPITSPRTRSGQLIYGVLYGASVVGLYIILRRFGYAGFSDKILFVPVLNLCVRFIDRHIKDRSIERLFSSHPRIRKNTVHVGVWIILFPLLLPTIYSHPGKYPSFWEAECELKKYNACENLTRLYYVYCDRGLHESCINLGQMWRDGTEVPKSIMSALIAFQKACDLGSGDGCTRLGDLVINEPEVTQGDQQEWIPRVIFERACDLGDASGCNNLAVINHRGLGGPKNTKLAIHYFHKACDAGVSQSCRTLAQIYARGVEVRRDYSAAAEMIKKACAAGDDKACRINQ